MRSAVKIIFHKGKKLNSKTKNRKTLFYCIVLIIDTVDTHRRIKKVDHHWCPPLAVTRNEGDPKNKRKLTNNIRKQTIIVMEHSDDKCDLKKVSPF